MVLLSLAEGNSVLVEKIFPDRFMHVAELNRMAASLRKEGPAVIIAGVKQLVAAAVMASDLRASAALVSTHIYNFRSGARATVLPFGVVFNPRVKVPRRAWLLARIRDSEFGMR